MKIFWDHWLAIAVAVTAAGAGAVTAIDGQQTNNVGGGSTGGSGGGEGDGASYYRRQGELHRHNGGSSIGTGQLHPMIRGSSSSSSNDNNSYHNGDHPITESQGTTDVYHRNRKVSSGTSAAISDSGSGSGSSSPAGGGTVGGTSLTSPSSSSSSFYNNHSLEGHRFLPQGKLVHQLVCIFIRTFSFYHTLPLTYNPLRNPSTFVSQHLDMDRWQDLQNHYIFGIR